MSWTIFPFIRPLSQLCKSFSTNPHNEIKSYNFLGNAVAKDLKIDWLTYVAILYQILRYLIHDILYNIDLILSTISYITDMICLIFLIWYHLWYSFIIRPYNRRTCFSHSFQKYLKLLLYCTKLKKKNHDSSSIHWISLQKCSGSS